MGQVSIYMILLIAVLTVGGFVYNRSSALSKFKQARAATGGKMAPSAWHSQASYHGYFTAWLVGLSTLAVFIIGLVINGQGLAFNAAWLAATILTALAVIILTGRKVSGTFRARTYVERFIHGLLITLSVIAVLTTLGIIASLLFESLRFFKEVPFMDFLFGLQWSPQTAMRADQVGQSGSFGAIPVFAGTFLIMLVAMAIAGPVGLMIAIYLTEYASAGVRKWVKPAIEILAGVPTVVYGFFVSRAIGETMIVYMAAGKAANLTANPFEAVTTVTVQIVALLTGDSDFDSAKTLVAFALGLVLFVITLILNVVALTVVRRYRAKY